MALLKKFPPEYFLKYKEKPVKLKAYNPLQGRIAEIYINKVSEFLKNYKVKTMIRGSTAYKILGKGDVEIGIYTNNSDWKNIMTLLEKEFGKTENIEKDYVRFNDICEGHEIEIIVLKGQEALQDVKLHNYLLKHSGLLKKYELIKKKYAFSKRVYQIQKNKFLSDVVDNLN